MHGSRGSDFLTLALPEPSADQADALQRRFTLYNLNT
jgi:hypothetical protein